MELENVMDAVSDLGEKVSDLSEQVSEVGDVNIYEMVPEEEDDGLLKKALLVGGGILAGIGVYKVGQLAYKKMENHFYNKFRDETFWTVEDVDETFEDIDYVDAEEVTSEPEPEPVKEDKGKEPKKDNKKG